MSENAPSNPPAASASAASQSTLTDEDIREMLVEMQAEAEEISLLTEQLSQHSQRTNDTINDLVTQTSELRNLATILSTTAATGTASTPLVQSASRAASVHDLSHDDLSLQTPTHLPEFDQTSKTTEASNAQYPDEILVNINNLDTLLHHQIQNSSMDAFKVKDENNFRLILQNPNGIKIYQDQDPEYLPSMTSLKEHQADIICLPGTNVPWHKSDFLYDVTKQNQATWQGLPTKTVAASCRSETKTLGNYLPGGVLTVVTNTMTTK